MKPNSPRIQTHRSVKETIRLTNVARVGSSTKRREIMVGGSNRHDAFTLAYLLSGWKVLACIGRVSLAAAAKRAQCYRNSSSTTWRDPRGSPRGERNRECESERECEPGVTSYRRKTVDYVCLTPHFRKATVMFEHEK